MPESAELKLSCEALNTIIKNKIVINMYPSKTGRYGKQSIEGFSDICQHLAAKVEDVNVKGKFMYWTFSNGHYMFCTYGMTGQWSDVESKHTAFTIQYCDHFDSIEQAIAESKFLHFNDPRHFGTIKFVNSKRELEAKLNSLGWDPWTNPNIDWIKKKINKNKAIGELLMDQSIFCGVGNYIRAEALYRAKINPWAAGKNITIDQLQQLCNHIKDVISESYYLQGASFQSYQNVDQEKGKYSNFFKVYGQKEDPNGYNIKREKMGSRTIHWCPQVQV